MLRTKLLSTSGMLLILGSILLGTHFWAYQTRVIMLQAGILAMGLSLFFRLDNRQTYPDPMGQLDDIERGFPK